MGMFPPYGSGGFSGYMGQNPMMMGMQPGMGMPSGMGGMMSMPGMSGANSNASK